jgi:hypothetical protein
MLLVVENCVDIYIYILKHLHENTLAYYTMSQSAKKLPYSVQSDIFLHVILLSVMAPVKDVTNALIPLLYEQH